MSAGPEAEPHGSWLGRTLENPSAAVYGLITVAAVLAVESPRRETFVKTIGAALITMVIYWLAHAYASLLGSRLQAGSRLSVRALLGVMRAEAPLLAGAAVPVLVLLAVWALGGSLETGTSVAVWTSAAGIVAAEVWAGLRAGATGAELALEAGTGTLLGLMLIALKVLLH